jgi:hypothetical protein
MTVVSTRMSWLLCALVFAVGVLLWPGSGQAGGVATPGSPARLSVSVPPAARGAGVVMLEIAITARRPAAGHFGAVVRLRPSGGTAVEVGRISVTGSSEQRYQLNASSALRGASSAEVEIELVDRGGGGGPMASGAELVIGDVRIVAR